MPAVNVSIVRGDEAPAAPALDGHDALAPNIRYVALQARTPHL